MIGNTLMKPGNSYRKVCAPYQWIFLSTLSVSVLCCSGAEAEYSDSDGWTAAHHASWSTTGLDFLKELLRKHPVLKEATTSNGHTPLHVACRYVCTYQALHNICIFVCVHFSSYLAFRAHKKQLKEAKTPPHIHVDRLS